MAYDKVDFHIHTWGSYDACIPLKIIERVLEKKNLYAVVLDHQKIPKLKSPRVINGEEVYTDVGDLICFNISEKIDKGPWQEVIDNVKSQGGQTVLAHPSRTKIPKELVKKVDAIEILNGRSGFKKSLEAFMWAKDFKKPMVAGSDAHFFWGIGRCYTFIDFEKLKEGKFKVKTSYMHSHASIFSRGLSTSLADIKSPKFPPRLVKRLWKRLV